MANATGYKASRDDFINTTHRSGIVEDPPLCLTAEAPGMGDTNYRVSADCHAPAAQGIALRVTAPVMINIRIFW